MNRKNRIFIVVMTCVLVVMASFTVARPAKAYTEEEKAQAKAWLSAHGYSADYGGASQAYQDYLNGKFDEELGLNSSAEGNSGENGTEQGNTAEQKEEITTEEKNKAPGPKKEKPGQNESGADGGKDSVAGENAKVEDNAEDKKNTVAQENAEGDSSAAAKEEGESVKKQQESENQQTIQTLENPKQELWVKLNGGIDHTKSYKKAVTVVFLGVIVMILMYTFMQTFQTKEFQEERKKKGFLFGKKKMKDGKEADSEEEEMRKKAGM